MKFAKTKNRNKLVITINFRGEAFGIFTPKQFESTAADFEKKSKN